jgi:hypothetical protein
MGEMFTSFHISLLILLGTLCRTLTIVFCRTSKRIGSSSSYLILPGMLCARREEFYLYFRQLGSFHISVNRVFLESFAQLECGTWSFPKKFLRYLRSRPVILVFTRIERVTFEVFSEVFRTPSIDMHSRRSIPLISFCFRMSCLSLHEY